ncbi:hypothetical protein PXD04_06915 [Methanosphaera sp. ISO3-F5]|uniref:hypothetical protein n=1 Tax=Methanosphaera sp. ISO3-F5 TaxID=1452353 RepID=UPI002B25CF0B|nr:hypothetical protein [Methanosphaera sp. ISO3-F5]WQH63434.1 hypothetical protein PXD04_06915 [Methanosphaera sp. ISO3-F5]
MPNKEQTEKQKDCLRRNSQRKTNTNKKDGYRKHNMIKDEENYAYSCPENKILDVKQIYPGKYTDRILDYTNEYNK